MVELGIEVKLTVHADASAAKGIASRTGLGKVRRIEVYQLWIQENVATVEVDLRKIPGTENTEDALTSYLDRNLIAWHMKHVGQEFAEGRHHLMPEVQKSTDHDMPVLCPAEREFAEEDPEMSERAPY